MSEHYIHNAYSYPPSASGDDSVSGIYTTGGATEDLGDSDFRAKVQEEERRIFAMYGIDSDFEDTFSSMKDTNGNEVGVDYSVDGADYSVDGVDDSVGVAVDYSANAADDSVVSFPSSIFERSYDGIMKTLTAFTPHKEHPDSPRRTEGTGSSNESDSKENGNIHEDWYLDLDSRHQPAPPPNTIAFDPEKQGTRYSGMTFKERARKARWITLILPCLFIVVVVGVGGGVIAYTKKGDSDDSSPTALSPSIPDESPTQPVATPETSDETPSVISEEPSEATPAGPVGETEVEPEETPVVDAPDETETVPEETPGGSAGGIEVVTEEIVAEETPVDDCESEVAASCAAHFNHGCTTDGLYWVSPGGKDDGVEPFQVYCDQTATVFGITGGWTLILTDHFDEPVVVEEPVIPATSRGLIDDHWVILRDSMSAGIMIMDANGETAFVTKEKLRNANCWTPWSVPTLVPQAGTAFVGLVTDSDGVIQSFSLFRSESGACNLAGQDFCTLRVGTNDAAGSGPFNYCDGGWDVFPHGKSWSYQQRVLFYIR